MSAAEHIVPREGLNFGLDDNMPRYWFGNDAYKTRVMDAVQSVFPDGERYFITSVRAFRDQITDPKLRQEVTDFMRQEGQHGIVHSKYNDFLLAQGMPIEGILRFAKHRLKGYTEGLSPEYNLALTAAFEHITALMAATFFAEKRTLAGADMRMQALFGWHAIEEMEHKAVAFDVMTKVAKVGYLKRAAAMTHALASFTALTLLMPNVMLKADGYNRWERLRMTAKGASWLYGRKGIFTKMGPQLRDYYRPSFHPWQHPAIPNYKDWLAVWDQTADPIAAGEALVAAAA